MSFFRQDRSMELSMENLVSRINILENNSNEQSLEIEKLKDRISNLNMALAFKSGKKPSEAVR